MTKTIATHDKSYTTHVLSTTNPSSPWYEYCPSTEAEFKETMSEIVKNQLSKNKSLRIMAMNEMIKRHSIGVDFLSEKSADSVLVDVYWAFYQRNFITIGYTKAENIGMQVFSVPAQKRKDRHVH